MNIDNVMTQLGAALKTIPGLRVNEWNATSVRPPAAYVTLPERKVMRLTYGNAGPRKLEGVRLVIAVAALPARIVPKLFAPWLDTTGVKSVQRAVEGYTYTACDSVTIKEATTDEIEIADVPFVAVIFQTEIWGT